MPDKSRRKLLKSIAVGSGAVILPAHAQTSPENYQQTLSADPCNGATSGPAKTTSLNFDTTGITPASNGTLVATSSGDIGDLSETYTVSIEGTSLIGP